MKTAYQDKLPMAKLVTILSTLVLFCFNNVESQLDKNNKTLLESILNGATEGVVKTVNFMNTDYSEMNMDGVFGMRLCQGILYGTMEDCSRPDFSCPSELVDKLKDLYNQLNISCNKALPYIQAEKENYYNIYLPAIEAPCMLNYIPETFPPASVDNINTNIVYEGQKGNYCYSSIMGTSKVGERAPPKCTIPEECWKMATVKGTVGYYTTHQLLYLIYGEHNECHEELEELIRRDNFTSMRDMERYLCQQIHLDATYRERNSEMQVEAEDLFLEQVLLCSVLGFQNFFTEKWMRMVISWQTARGCFTNPPHLLQMEYALDKDNFKILALEKQLLEEGDRMDPVTKYDIKSHMSDLLTQYDLLTLMLQSLVHSFNLSRGVPMSRSLLNEKVVNGDCLAHKTGLGAGALAAFIRHIVGLLYSSN
uniref:Uncharacterized protein n=1 Tax=Arion vulgaris TaxID=1028688 RepID=A0A0B6Z888_9EUPU